jgi:hypothetical protein
MKPWPVSILLYHEVVVVFLLRLVVRWFGLQGHHRARIILAYV